MMKATISFSILAIFILSMRSMAYELRSKRKTHFPRSPSRLAMTSTSSSTSSSSSSWSEAQKPDIPIIYESERMLVLNKPPGIAHHDDEQGPGIVTLVREQQGQRVWGVHRLDRVTSGILLMAKDEGMAQALTRAFANGEISKLYLGISAKKPTKKKQGLVQGRMVRSRDKSWKLTRNTIANTTTATAATTTTTIMENYAKTRFFTAPLLWSGQDERGGTSEPEEEQTQRQQPLTLILFRPYTGKTHQLRVAAKSMGLPLLGDPVYRDGSQNNKSPSDGTMVVPSRTYLHASGILVPALQGILSDPLALWCPPSFDQILGEQPTAISDLMQKRCDIPELLEAMKMTMEAP